MLPKGVVVPQVFRMNRLLEMNIELSDNTNASTWEFLVVETMVQFTMERRSSSLDLTMSRKSLTIARFLITRVQKGLLFDYYCLHSQN